jgi:TOBE domain
VEWRWETWAGLAAILFVLYVGAFALGIEVGESDREILEHYGDSGERDNEVGVLLHTVVGFRPEHLRFGSGAGGVTFDTRVEVIEYFGDEQLVHMVRDGTTLLAKLRSRST